MQVVILFWYTSSSPCGNSKAPCSYIQRSLDAVYNRNSLPLKSQRVLCSKNMNLWYYMFYPSKSKFYLKQYWNTNTVRPTRYQTRHFFNNSNTNEDIATKFEQEYVRCVRNEKECVCSVCL